MTNILQKKSKVQDHIDYKNKYKQIYGDNTVVLMLKWDIFMKSYAVLTDDIQEGLNKHSLHM